jgi:hypothetical protein
VTLADNCANTPLGQAYYGTDDTVAFQSAIDACTNYGGTIFVPDGQYFIDGEFQELDYAPDSFVQLKLPYYTSLTTNITINMFGPRVPQTMGIQWNVFGLPNPVGAIIVSARTALTTTNYTIIGNPRNSTDTWQFTYVRLGLENLTFRTQKDGRLCPLNLLRISQCDLKNVMIDTGMSAIMLTNAPRYDSYGLVLPGANNNVMTSVKSVMGYGFGTGVRVGECSTLDMVFFGLCKRGFEINPMGHASSGQYIYAIACSTGIVAQASADSGLFTVAPIHWSNFDTEQDRNAAHEDMWYTLSYDLYDPTSLLNGDISLWSAGEGNVRAPTFYGATNIAKRIVYSGDQFSAMFSIARLANDGATKYNNFKVLHLGQSPFSGPDGNDFTSEHYSIGTINASGLDGAGGNYAGWTMLNAPGGGIGFWKSGGNGSVGGGLLGTLDSTNGLQIYGSVRSTNFVGNGASLTNLAGTAIQAGTVSSNALDTATKAQLALGGSGGVVAAGTNIVVTTNGSVYTVSSTASGSTQTNISYASVTNLSSASIAGSQVTGATTVTNGLLASATAEATYLGINSNAATATTATNLSGPNLSTPTNTPTDAYVLTASGTGGASQWAAAAGGGAPLNGTNTWTGTNKFVSTTNTGTLGVGGATVTSGNITVYGGASPTTDYVRMLSAASHNIDVYLNSVGQSYVLSGDNTGSGGPPEFRMASGGTVTFRSTTRSDSGVNDVTLYRSSAGVFGIGIGSSAPNGSLILSNLTANGTVTAKNFAANTNAWALDTPIPFATNGLVLVSGAATGGITGVTGFPASANGCVELTVKATGDVVFTNVAGFRCSDGLSSRTITNGSTADIVLKVVPGVATNMYIGRCW